MLGGPALPLAGWRIRRHGAGLWSNQRRFGWQRPYRRRLRGSRILSSQSRRRRCRREWLGELDRRPDGLSDPLELRDGNPLLDRGQRIGASQIFLLLGRLPPSLQAARCAWLLRSWFPLRPAAGSWSARRYNVHSWIVTIRSQARIVSWKFLLVHAVLKDRCLHVRHMLALSTGVRLRAVCHRLLIRLEAILHPLAEEELQPEPGKQS